jgi:hypothetical protein
MKIQEKVREIVLSEKLSNTEKRDHLRALIPVEVFRIENLNQATPAQLKQLQEAIEAALASTATARRRRVQKGAMLSIAGTLTKAALSWLNPSNLFARAGGYHFGGHLPCELFEVISEKIR